MASRSPNTERSSWLSHEEYIDALREQSARFASALRDSALAVQRQLASTGRHRTVGVADLLIATLASAHDVTLIHYDGDFEIAAEVLPVRHQWVLQRGNI